MSSSKAYSFFFQLALLSHIGANYLNAGWEAQRHGTAHPSIVPYQAFTCQDGERLVVAAANDQFFKELCAVGLRHSPSYPSER